MVTPYRVHLVLGSPLAVEHPWIHGDAVLGYLAALRLLGRDIYDIPAVEVERQARLHRAECERRGWDALTGLVWWRGVPCCSVGVLEPTDAPWGTVNFYKRTELDAFPGRGKLSLGFGRYRSWMLRTQYIPAASCSFFACGDPATAAELLQRLVALGTTNRMGWGWVSRVEVEPCEEDWSLVMDGRATRPIPVRLLKRWSAAVMVTWQPPYWDRSGVELCAPPGAEVELA